MKYLIKNLHANINITKTNSKKNGDVTSQETWKKSLKEANKISFEKKIQSEFGQTVDTMITARASRNDVF